MLEADTGYLGLVQIHANSLLPKKRSKNHPLTRQERRNNREISRKRIFVEHAIRFLRARLKSLDKREGKADNKGKQAGDEGECVNIQAISAGKSMRRYERI